MNHLVGEIRLLPYDDVPVGFLKCQGQSLDINQYPKLYMMLGTKFGQDGEFKFTLPDMRGKAPPGLVYCIAAEGKLPKLQADGEDGGMSV